MKTDQLQEALLLIKKGWLEMEAAVEIPLKTVQEKFPDLDKIVTGRLDEAVSHLFQANECLESVIGDMRRIIHRQIGAVAPAPLNPGESAQSVGLSSVEPSAGNGAESADVAPRSNEPRT